MAKKKIYVVPHDDGWAVKSEGSSRAAKVTRTKKEAEEEAYGMVSRHGGEIIIQNKDGNFSSRRSVSKEDDDGSCFITTACISYHNLANNCYQLSTLRNFRDIYLSQTEEGKNLIKTYYKVAPKLVSSLNQSQNRNLIYNTIFRNINKACSLIEKGEMEKAKALYVNIVIKLHKKFPPL
jgi:hypothetical protein